MLTYIEMTSGYIFKEFIKNLFRKSYERLGWSDIVDFPQM
jgi:hypothetical protein